MTNLVNLPSRERARQEAASWIVRVDRGLSAEEREALRTWAAVPLHKRTLQDMAALWNHLDVLNALAELFPREAPAPAPATPPYRLRAMAAALAGTLAVAVTVGLYFQGQRAESSIAAAYAPHSPQIIETAIGAQRQVALGDGSAVTLNTDTQLAVVMQPDHRDLRLDRGEAHFRVAHDDRVPFRVFVGRRMIQAVGTAFSVRLLASGEVEVLVTEGTVRVDAQHGRPGLQPRLVAAQQLAHIDDAGETRVESVAAVEMDIRLAWQRGMLIFQGEPLGTVLGEFGRYTTENFVLTDPRLGRLRVGGYFRAGDTDALLVALRENFRILSSRDAQGRIVLTASR